MMDVNKLARRCILERKNYIPGKPIEEVEREYGFTDILKMASNENPLGTSPKAIEAMVNEIRESSHLYPDSLCFNLANKIALEHEVSPASIYIDNGADAVISIIGFTFLNAEDEAIYGEISFPTYESIVTRMGAKPRRIPLTGDYRLDINGFLAALAEKTKIIYLCNPNNPTGTITTRKEFEHLLAATPDNVIIVSDEAYCDFVDDDRYPNTIKYLETHDNLVIIRTFSKVMGLAGLRAGYALANPEIIETMRKARDPFSINRIAQAGAIAALDDTEFVEKTIRVNGEGRDYFYKSFEKMNLEYCRSNTNFVLVDVGIDASLVFKRLLEKGIIVRPLGSQGLKNALRITVGLKDQNERTVKALREVLKRGQA